MSKVDRSDILETKQFLLSHTASKIHDESVFEQFVRRFSILFEAFRLQTEGMADSERLLLIDTFSIWILRSTQYISNKKIDTDSYMKKLRQELLNIKNCGIIFQYIIDFWVDGASAFISSLGGMFSKFLRLLNTIYLLEDRKILFNSWLIETLQVSSTLSVQYYLIDFLSPETDLSLILVQRPEFIENALSLLWSDSLSNPIGKCITSLLVNVYKIRVKGNGLTLDSWFDLWQDPVLKNLQDIRLSKPTELYILMPLFRNVPKEVFSRFIQRVFSSVNIALLISLFRVGQKLGLEEEPYHNDKLIPLSTIENLLQEDEHKLHAFELLTFSIKSSRPVHTYIFEIIRRNLRIFFVDTNIETRNYFSSSLKHFILRIRDSTYSLNRDRNKLIKAKKFPEEQVEKLNQIKESQEFLNWMFQFLKTQICPGTQYQRNALSFKILVILLETGIDKSVHEKYLDSRNFRPYPFSIFFSKDKVLHRLLIENLTSNYDDIRRIAKKLLTVAFDHDASNDAKGSFNWENVQEQATQYLEVYQNADIGAALQDFLFLTCNDQDKFIEDLLNKLQEKIEKGKEDYSNRQDDPISGYFAALTLVLKNNKFDADRSKVILSRCFSLIFSNWDVAKEFLCNPSEPKIPDSTGSGQAGNDPFIIAKAFRSIKESSLLLEVLVTRDFVTVEQLKSAGNLMIIQLSNLKHSGAFQSVLPSFIACCSQVSKNYPTQLKEWLGVVLDFLESKTQMVTRRSGGIPFLLTIILAAEGGTERPLLQFAYETLKRVASLPVDQDQQEYDLPQVNAFNCIRLIFIESKLSKACSPYISSALGLSLKNFNSGIYPLRNCSLMLFSSLQNRVFGKAGKSISARLFFTRYGGIRELLLNVLKDSLISPSNSNKDLIVSQYHVESIFLVLNVLVRLRPTPGYDGLDIFIQKVSECLESPHWKIREMAAKTISSLTHDPLSQCEELLSTASVKNQNKLHGHLLAVRAIIMDKRETLEEKKEGTKLFESLYSMRILTNNLSFVTSKEYIETIGYVLSWSTTIPYAKSDFLSQLGHFFLYHNEHFSLDGAKQLCLSSALEILLRFEQSDNIQLLCELGLLSSFHEVQKVAVDYVENGLSFSNTSNLDILKALKNGFLKNKFKPSLQGRVLRVLMKSGYHIDLAIIKDLILHPENEDLQLSAIEMLGCVTDLDDMEFMDTIVQKYADENNSVDSRMAASNCLKNFLRRVIEPKTILQLHKMLSDDDEEIRMHVASCLNELFLQDPQCSKSSSVTGALVAEKYGIRFIDSSDAPRNVVQNLKQFIISYDLYSSTTGSPIQGLFEVEKNNQFRNEIEENIQRINILKKMKYHSKEFISWLDSFVDQLMKFLEDSNVFDGPLGWSSNSVIFSRIHILRILSNMYLCEKSLELERILRYHNVHPMVFEYLSIDV